MIECPWRDGPHFHPQLGQGPPPTTATFLKCPIEPGPPAIISACTGEQQNAFDVGPAAVATSGDSAIALQVSGPPDSGPHAFFAAAHDVVY